MSAENTPLSESREVETATRIGGEFFIRGVEIVARAHGNDLLKGIIFTAIAVANTEAGPPVAEERERRPVSVMSIAGSIGVPYETTRRYVNLLVDEGLCERLGRRGVVITDAALTSPSMRAAAHETYTSFNRLVSALRRARYAGLG